MKITPKILEAAKRILAPTDPYLGYGEYGGLSSDARFLAENIIREHSRLIAELEDNPDED